mmetsp:Transcript_81926/g.265523  ORF Transcript_81926/g.265523 Transcript_81926/m.265523 type:complete len:781 (+) Transcript_81926:16-2358(+)
MRPASTSAALAAAVLSPLLLEAAARLHTRGSDVYDGDVRIRFKGIGVTCTEYMLKMGMDTPSKGEYPGHWAYNYCFAGPASDGGRVELNEEPANMLRYLLPDSRGGSFLTRPQVTKVQFKKPYSEVVPPDVPEVRPITRIPMTGSLYLYESHAALYREIIDKMVQAFTSQGVAVILDLHWNCPDTSEMTPCTGAQAASMALRHFGSKPGALAFWDAVSRRYAGNSLVLYELFNEPWIMQYGDWYKGSATYAGMKDMYQVVRKNAPEGLIVIGGKDQYALDAQSGLAFYLQLKEETGSYPTNVIWNVHPYVGLGQGLEHSLGSALRLALALKTVGPVIFTEFGQYCCGGSGDPCAGKGTCSDEDHGAHFVHNVVNMAEQYDISWIGWAWRGAGSNNMHRPCEDGMAECSQPDMRDLDGEGRAALTDGRRAGADWAGVWARFVAPAGGSIAVEDAEAQGTTKEDPQPKGFLPRPCIAEGFNLGSVCGWGPGTNVTSLSPAAFTKQAVYTSVLPGLPGSCGSQACPGHACGTWTGPCRLQGAREAGEAVAADAGSKKQAEEPADHGLFFAGEKEPEHRGDQAEGTTTTAAGAAPAGARNASATAGPPAAPAASPRPRGSTTSPPSAPPAKSVTPVPAQLPASTCAAAYHQCGGQPWNGPTCCEDGCTCTAYGAFYSQCVPPIGSGSCSGSAGTPAPSAAVVMKAGAGASPVIASLPWRNQLVPAAACAAAAVSGLALAAAGLRAGRQWSTEPRVLARVGQTQVLYERLQLPGAAEGEVLFEHA